MLKSRIKNNHFEMGKKLTGKALTDYEAKRNVWQEVLDGVRETRPGEGNGPKLMPNRMLSVCG